MGRPCYHPEECKTISDTARFISKKRKWSANDCVEVIGFVRLNIWLLKKSSSFAKSASPVFCVHRMIPFKEENYKALTIKFVIF